MGPMTPFADRRDAGRRLASRLADVRLDAPVVLALPRGGVPVAAEVARALGAPLDVFVARKLGAPGRQEYGIGAIAEGADGEGQAEDGGAELVLTDAVGQLHLSDDELARLVLAEQAELARRVARYRAGRPLPRIAGADVVLVDDGIATGVTAEAALRSLRRRGPRRLVLAVPVCAREAARRLAGIADTVVCVGAPEVFWAVGSWYDDFSQTSDAEVVAILADLAGRADTAGPARPARPARPADG